MKAFKGLLIGFAAAAALTTASPAFADYLPGEVDTAERTDDLQMVVAFLASEQFAPSRIEFRSLSADPVRDLVKVAESGKYPVALRARAVQSLPLYVADERARTAVDKLMTSTSPGQKLFGPALVAYAAIHGESVTEAVAPYAEHPDAKVRLAAVVALGRFCGQLGYETLKNLVDSEENESVKARMRQLVD